MKCRFCQEELKIIHWNDRGKILAFCVNHLCTRYCQPVHVNTDIVDIELSKHRRKRETKGSRNV
jgi:hypothetical protein